MSAIAGVFHDHDEPVSIEVSEKMMKSLAKYPANHVRTWHDRSVFMGCHAQWFTPESVHDRQPCYDERHGLVIAADAIIDNREELFNRLQVEHSRRKRMTDSELIVEAYLKWGEDAPSYIIGDFAFVIWDDRRRRLFGARDLAGSRTLYYVHRPGQFAFCTVMNPLLALPGVRKELNESWLAEFLAIPIILDTIDVRSTVYRHIGQIPPAHSFTVEDGSLKVERYGTLAADVPKLKLRSNGEYEEAFREVFREAVVSKLRTSRNVGASLSGGLDSGAVVSFAAGPLREEGKTLYTYSYVPRPDFTDWTPRSMVADERPYIQAVVDHVGNIAHSHMDFADRNSFEEINDLLELMEAPYKFFENSYWFRGILEQANKDDVSILLHGGSGNYTISWGPALDYYARLLRKLRWVRLYRELEQYGKNMRVGRSRLLPFIGKMAFASPSPSSKPLPNIPLLIHPELAERTGVFDKLKHHDVGLNDSWMNEFEARTYQFDQLSILNHQGTSSTKLSLKYAVRERDPTCDPRVVRFCLSVPVEQYVQNGMDRSLVRRATERYLPESVRLNQRVRGVQGADWIHRVIPSWSAVTEELHELCRDTRASRFLNVEQIKASLTTIGHPPKPEQAFDRHARLLMQSLIVYRFIRQCS
ncbi:asparagine synthase-related protein [Cohnella nanjingensis]|uniref:asparagine synthase (glutamine-hydrolyzing) n=1 Tax=Cohnella nanjingensis TaxID=1387779 RepID=A0A7X0RRB7_9BACL|nr:asparagine synthase-related protein [Cohnella nanjingensis]MBB6672267.1 asparagine synthetase B [Cohnella nanjingensis]